MCIRDSLTEDLAAEQKARTVYDNLLRMITDPDNEKISNTKMISYRSSLISTHILQGSKICRCKTQVTMSFALKYVFLF